MSISSFAPVCIASKILYQTKDHAMRALQNHGLAVENVYATEALVLNGLINKFGFYNINNK
jgi:hypothetical protein